MSQNRNSFDDQYYSNLVELARELNVAVILDSATWVANRDRGADLGYSPDDLKKINIEAIGLIANVREEKGDLPTVLCGQVGPPVAVIPNWR